jgi:HPt (histidine-containing phosphotransfer) domain-containing protein
MVIDSDELQVARHGDGVLLAPAGAFVTPAGAVDMAMLESFAEAQIDGEPDLVVELIDLYLTDTVAKMGALRKALANSDEPTLRRLAHCLRGSSGNLGARLMAERCKELEQVGGDDWHHTAGDLLHDLEGEFERVAVIFAAERRKRT